MYIYVAPTFSKPVQFLVNALKLNRKAPICKSKTIYIVVIQAVTHSSKSLDCVFVR